jgi:Caspase domain/Domain of unknown function (DUF4384)
MRRQRFTQGFAGAAVVMAAGLGLGFGSARLWRADFPLPVETPAALAVSFPTQGTAERSRAVTPEPAPVGPSAGRRALLVGVTKYDHLPRDRHLAGPANDVTLMRRLLQERYKFPAAGIVTLSEDESTPDRRPTRANIEREFRHLAEQAREGDQVVILLAGHGSQQPESDPPDPVNPEPDGLDEIFLPADIGAWNGTKERLPGAIVDDELGAWLRAITAKRAYVWAIFDCCHSGTMTRAAEIVRELPPETLVPREELAKARQRADQRQKGTRGASTTEPASFVPQESSEYLVAVYACRPTEVTPESPQPPESPRAAYYGLLTYSLVHVLTEASDSIAPPTYRELVRRLQVQYAGRPQGSPTPLVEGKRQDRIVLGTEEVIRSPLVLTRDKDGYKVNAGDLYGLTPGSILAVDSASATGTDGKPKLLGHVQVVAIRPFDATVEPCASEGSALVKELAPFSTCRVVLIDCALRRFKVAIVAPEGQEAVRRQVQRAMEPLADPKSGLVNLVESPQQADWVVRLDKGKLEMVEACGNRDPFALPGPDSPALGEALRQSMGKIYRALNLVAVSSRFESERARGASAVDVEVEVLRHKNPTAGGEVFPAPEGGRVFRPGDLISFRVHNNSPALRVDVTLLVVGSDFEIHPFYPQRGESVQTLERGQTLTTPPPPGEISNDPPFGKEYLVVIAAPASNPPADFTALEQSGLPLARAADRSRGLQSPLGQLLETAMFRTGKTRGLGRSVSAQQGMRVLQWRTEPK